MAKQDTVKVKPFRLTLKVDKKGYISSEGATVTIKCPYCGKEHTHGFLTGYRVPHCTEPKHSDYWVDCDKFTGEVVVTNPLGIKPQDHAAASEN